MIVNTGTQPSDAEATFDLKAPKQPAELTVRDVPTDKDIPINNGRVSVPLGPLEHSVLWLKPR